jgi:hypothetical protein
VVGLEMGVLVRIGVADGRIADSAVGGGGSVWLGWGLEAGGVGVLEQAAKKRLRRNRLRISF